MDHNLWTVHHIDINPFSRVGRKKVAHEFLVWHYTANPGASAENHIAYFQGLKNQNTNDDARYAGAELFVDRDSAVEIIPLDEEAFHAGKRWYNQRSIGIELCIEKDGSFHPDTIKRAVKIGAYLCSKYKMDPLTKQIRHFDVTGKICPKPWVERPILFDKFKQDVAAAMKGEYEMSAEDAKKIIGFLQGYWKTATEKEVRDEIHRLANEIRKSANLPIA